MGNFGPLVRAGLDDILRGRDVQVLHGQDRTLLDEVAVQMPDVVVIDLDRVEATTLATHIATGYPSLTVVACSTERPMMQVFPPFGDGDSYVSELRPDLFADVVTT
jgi:DNA-binding NarL/FixJ family response regulator